ncbi:hypothetical protein BKA81DRAFT_397582 [Phyllosticta paracitricarpa]
MPPALSDSDQESPRPSKTASPEMPLPDLPGRRRSRRVESSPEDDEADRPLISSLPPRNKRSRLLSGLHPSQDIIDGLSQGWDVPSTAPATHHRKTRARTSTNTGKKPNYNAKHHPMDDVLRPKQAKKHGGLVERITISSDEEDVNDDEDGISQESRRGRRRRSSSSYVGNAVGRANARGRSKPARRSKRRSTSNPAYRDDVHPMDNLADFEAISDSGRDDEDEAELPRTKKRKTIDRSKMKSKQSTGLPGDTSPDTDETLVPGSSPETPPKLTIEEIVERIDAVIKIGEELKPAKASLLAQMKKKSPPAIQVHRDSEEVQAHALGSRPDFPLPREGDFPKENFVASLPRENSHTNNVELEEVIARRITQESAEAVELEEVTVSRNVHGPLEAAASSQTRIDYDDVEMDDSNAQHSSPRNAENTESNHQDMDDDTIQIEPYVLDLLNGEADEVNEVSTIRQTEYRPAAFTPINSSPSVGETPASSNSRSVDSTACISPQRISRTLPIRSPKNTASLPTVRDTHLTMSQSREYNSHNILYNPEPHNDDENEPEDLDDDDDDMPMLNNLLMREGCYRQRSLSL